MKKLLYLLMVTMVLGAISCKKDSNLKPVAPQPKPKEVEKTAVTKFDYQKAIREKRSQ